MPSQDKQIQTSEHLLFKTVLVLLAIGLNGFELFLPRIPFLPWFKPGFANIITIIWLTRFGMADALLFTVLRSWISGFYFGFSLLTLTLSLSGGLFSTLIMSMAWNVSGKKGALGTIGIGILGAFIHNCGQLIVVYFLLTKNNSVFYQIPFMIVASLAFGGLTGFLVPTVMNIVERGNSDRSGACIRPDSQLTFQKKEVFFSLLTITSCFSLFLITRIDILLTVSLLFSLLAYKVTDRKIDVLYYPLRFKYLFLFIALTYVLFSPGKRLTPLPFPTDEGIREAIIQLLRIWTWIIAGLILQKFNFNTIVFSSLTRLFPQHQSTLSCGLLALEYFPEIVGPAPKNKSNGFKKFFRSPIRYIHEYCTMLYRNIEEKVTTTTLNKVL